MSYTWAADRRGEDDEPRGVHTLSCAVWNSNGPCDCRPSTADRLDLIAPCDEPWLEGA